MSPHLFLSFFSLPFSPSVFISSIRTYSTMLLILLTTVSLILSPLPHFKIGYTLSLINHLLNFFFPISFIMLPTYYNIDRLHLYLCLSICSLSHISRRKLSRNWCISEQNIGFFFFFIYISFFLSSPHSQIAHVSNSFLSLLLYVNLEVVPLLYLTEGHFLEF